MFKKTITLCIFLSLAVFVSCGNDTEKNSANAVSAEYYSQFITSVDDADTGVELIGTVTSSYGSRSTNIKITLDANGTFSVCPTYDNVSLNKYEQQQVESECILGQWYIQGDYLYLEDVAQTVRCDNSYYNDSLFKDASSFCLEFTNEFEFSNVSNNYSYDYEINDGDEYRINKIN